MPGSCSGIQSSVCLSGPVNLPFTDETPYYGAPSGLGVYLPFPERVGAHRFALITAIAHTQIASLWSLVFSYGKLREIIPFENMGFIGRILPFAYSQASTFACICIFVYQHIHLH